MAKKNGQMQTSRMGCKSYDFKASEKKCYDERIMLWGETHIFYIKSGRWTVQLYYIVERQKKTVICITHLQHESQNTPKNGWRTQPYYYST